MSFDFVRRTYTIVGDTPMLMNNGRMANPLDEFAKAIKLISKKRNKTEDDFAKMADLEWEGGLYLDDKQKICVPGSWIKGMIVSAGKKRKLGKTIKESLISQGPPEHNGMFPLKFDGDNLSFEKLKASAAHRDIRAVIISGRKVMRCRPIFHGWSLTFWVDYLEDQIDSQDLDDLVVIGGRLICLSNFRPEYGHFHTVAINGQTLKAAAA